MLELVMEIRDVQPTDRLMVGVVVPYDEISYLVPSPSGERIRRGAFAKSIRQRGGKIPLFRNHDHALKLGVSRKFTEDAAGLIGEFTILGGDRGDELLDDLRNGYLDKLSAGFKPLTAGRASDGVTEVKEGQLEEVSAVALAAYAGAAVLAVRNAQSVDELLAPFQNPPAVNLAPLPPIGYRPR